MKLDKKKSKFKLILTSFCCLLCLSCFCSADLIAEIQRTSRSLISSETSITFTWDSCAMKTSWNMTYDTWWWAVTMNHDYQYCFASWDTVIFSWNTWMNRWLLVEYRDIWNECPACPSCPSQYTSLECQQEYSLIPVSSVDQNYCVSNYLCPSTDCPGNTWDVNWSALYINNIQHLWGAIIRVDIPEEIDRDYTQWTGEFDLDIVGYNVDYEAIQNKIDIQNYKPSQEDFNNVIWVLAWYMPLIVILIWFVVILSLIKKPFKSKL